MSETQSLETVEYNLQLKRDAFNPFSEGGSWEDFANELTAGYMGSERGDHVPVADFHLEWLDLFESDDDFILMCMRDGLKTTISLTYVIACLEYLPGFRVTWISNTRPQAYKKADSEFNKFVDRNPWLTNLNGGRVQDGKETKEWVHGSILNSGWLFGAIEGERAHLMILDDVIKERGDGDTDRIEDWISGVTVPIVKDGGKIAMIGTRKREDDIYSVLKEQDGYELREYPAVLDIWDDNWEDDNDFLDRRPDEDLYTTVEDPFNGGTMKVLWADARGPRFLKDKYDKQSQRLFYREYCLSLIGSSGNLISSEDVDRAAHDGGCSIRNRHPPEEYYADQGELNVIGVDPASSPTGDYLAITVWNLLGDTRRRLLHGYAEKGVMPSTFRRKLIDLDARYDPAMIVVESNGVQQYIANDAIEISPQMRAKIKGMPTSGQKHSWENGIPRLRTLTENGGMLFYRGDGGTEDFLTAAQSLTLHEGKLKGHTPDFVASWYMAEKAIRHLAKTNQGRSEQERKGSGVRSV